MGYLELGIPVCDIKDFEAYKGKGCSANPGSQKWPYTIIATAVYTLYTAGSTSMYSCRFNSSLFVLCGSVA